MTDLVALKEALAEKQFNSELLAFAIVKYLSQTDPNAMRKILDLFNETMDHHYDILIKDQIDNIG